MPKLQAEPVDSDRTYPWGIDVDGLVAEHMDFARELAREWHGRGVDPDDLESEATVGLWEAAQRYQPGGRTFRSFTESWISVKLTNLVREQPWPGGITVPTDHRRARRKLQKAAAELLAEGIDRPTPEQVCERSGIGPDFAREVLGLPVVHSLPDDDL
jgi:RNA polymerase sigma factor (sigma-70 family)